ncbi:MAG: XdhC family protein [Actinomycetia bacterium]|nr:XdhC family protein [Actinomycetes bacterium]
MEIQILYCQLIQSLEQGARAAVVSQYYPDHHQKVEKHLVTSADTAAWSELQSQLAAAASQTQGSVTYLMNADGSQTVIERYSARPRMVILGGGHIALALVRMARLLDFEILVYDDRPSFANSARFPEADEVICDSFQKLFERVSLRANDYVVVVTRGHKHDQDSLAGVLRGVEPAYTGMIGSRRRVAIVLDQLRADGFDAARIGRIHSPIGLRIGAVTPAEIAVSIIAEVISVRRSVTDGGNLASSDLEAVQALAASPHSFGAIITVVQTNGSVPIECGAKLACGLTGEMAGTIGGGCSEAGAISEARDVLRKGGWKTYTVDMTDSAEEDGMVCGGEMLVMIEKVS